MNETFRVVNTDKLRQAFLAVVGAAHEVGIRDKAAEEARRDLNDTKKEYWGILEKSQIYGGQKIELSEEESEYFNRHCSNCKYLVKENNVCQQGGMKREDVSSVCSMWEQIGLECQKCIHWQRNDGENNQVGFCAALKKETRQERLCEIFRRKEG